MPILDPVKNFAYGITSTGYNNSATSIVLTTGHGARFPDPSTDGSFNLVWWNYTDYKDPSDDPNVEIVRVTARSTDTLTVTRGQEGTSGSTKNTAGKEYRMMLAPTKKFRDDIENYFLGIEKDYVHFFDDFFYSANTSTTRISTNPMGGVWSFDSSNITLNINEAPNGVIQISSPTQFAASGIYTHSRENGGNPSGFKANQPNTIFEARVRILDTSYFTRGVFRIGLSNNTFGRGIWFELDSASGWRGRRVYDQSGGGSNYTSYQGATVNWVVLKFVINSAGNSVEFFVDGVSIGTISNNLPINNNMGGTVYMQRTSASACTLDIDYFKLIQPRNT